MKFYLLPNSNCFPTVCYFSREKPLVKPTALGSLFIIFTFAIYFLLHLFSYLLNQKYKNTLLQFILIYFIWRLIYLSTTIYFMSVCLSWGAATQKGLTTPFTRWVASICYLCAGAVYVVLLGSPTSSITLVSSLRKIPTAPVLHHPFLFGEIPM